MAALPCLALSFTLLFFGPLDLAYLSREYVTWTAFDIFLPILGIWAAVFVCLWLFTSVIGGKAHAFLVSLWDRDRRRDVHPGRLPKSRPRHA